MEQSDIFGWCRRRCLDMVDELRSWRARDEVTRTRLQDVEPENCDELSLLTEWTVAEPYQIGGFLGFQPFERLWGKCVHEIFRSSL